MAVIDDVWSKLSSMSELGWLWSLPRGERQILPAVMETARGLRGNMSFLVLMEATPLGLSGNGLAVLMEASSIALWKWTVLALMETKHRMS